MFDNFYQSLYEAFKYEEQLHATLKEGYSDASPTFVMIEKLRDAAKRLAEVYFDRAVEQIVKEEIKNNNAHAPPFRNL